MVLKQELKLTLALVFVLSPFCESAWAQSYGQSAGQNPPMDEMLNALTNAPGWSNSVPDTGAQAQQFQTQPLQPRPFLNQGNPGFNNTRAVPSMFQESGPATPGQLTLRLLKALSGRSSPASSAVPNSVGFGSGSGPGARAVNGDDASSNYYRALDQASRARNAYDRSFYGDKYSRQQAANEAYYAAQEARYEADRAFEKVAANPSAQTNAERALAAAQDAQGNADRARGNADRARDRSDGGW